MGCMFIQPESKLSLPKPPTHKSLTKAMDSDIAEGKNTALCAEKMAAGRKGTKRMKSDMNEYG